MSTTTATPPSASSLNALHAGHRLAEFEILGLVGEGGFGIVYLAQDHSLHRRVAIKEYMPAMLASRAPDATTVLVRSSQHAETFEIGLRSFVNEARLLARFDHPALVKVFRFWEGNGTAYMAMPYYEGRNLRQICQERDPHDAFDESWLLRTLAPVIDALEVMHAQNVFHRDVAPDNILLLADGRPLLLDLGAARRVIGDKTQALTVILKAGYAPVEQYATAPGVEQGPWTDVYALAAVMHVLISRQVPPAAVTRVLHDNYVPLARAMREASAPWTQSRGAAYSTRFLEGIDRCLEVRGAHRPQSMAQMRECLGIGVAANAPVPLPVPVPVDNDATVILPAVAPPALARAITAPAPVPEPAPSAVAAPQRRWFAAAAGASLLALIGGAAYVMRRREEPVASTPAVAAPTPVTPPRAKEEAAAAVAPAPAPAQDAVVAQPVAPPRPRPRPRPKPAEGAPNPIEPYGDRATVREQNRKLDELLGNRPAPSPAPSSPPSTY